MFTGKFVGITVQSGCSGAPWAIQPSPRRHAEDLATNLGCTIKSTVEMLDCMRNVSAEMIMQVKLIQKFIERIYSPQDIVFLVILYAFKSYKLDHWSNRLIDWFNPLRLECKGICLYPFYWCADLLQNNRQTFSFLKLSMSMPCVYSLHICIYFTFFIVESKVGGWTKPGICYRYWWEIRRKVFNGSSWHIDPFTFIPSRARSYRLYERWSYHLVYKM